MARSVFSQALKNKHINEPFPLQLPGGRARVESWGLGLLALAAVCWFYWSTLQPGGGLFFSKERSGYYGALTKGFCEGHLHVDFKPAPGLLALKDPYDPVANAPYRVHDMTLWKGNYYLYYGVSPVLILFWPVVALTGLYPTEAFAVATFCSVGVVLALGLLGSVRRRFYPTAPSWALAAGALVIVWANPVALLTQLPQFYQVPIACAFALHMMMLGAIYRSLVGAPKHRIVWLAVASFCYGLSVGARPNYFLSGFALVVPWVVLVWRSNGKFMSGVRLGLAAFGPAVAVGVGLLLYNWLRFGSVSEFGIKYTLGGERIPDIKLMGLEYVWPHLGDYLFRAGNWGRYFPFFSAPVGVPHGSLRYGPWLLLIPSALLLRGRGKTCGGLSFGWTIAVAAGANLALLCVFFGLTDRYPPDFVPALLLLAGIGGLALGERVRTLRGAGFVSVVLAGVTIFIGMAVWVKRFPDQARVLSLARWVNMPVAWWEQSRNEMPGGLKFELELPRGREGLSEPLVHCGVAPDARDWLQIDYLAGDRARLGFFHAGLGMLPGSEFAIPLSRRITVELECGALLPPAAHPMFADWTTGQQLSASRHLSVRVDGAETLSAALSCYESTPADLTIGRMRFISGGVQGQFTGKLTKLVKTPTRRPKIVSDGVGTRTPLELKLVLPTDKTAGREPLMSTGTPDKCDILFIQYEGLGKAVFGLYHYGFEPTLSQIFTYDPLVPHSIKVWLGSLAAQSESSDPAPIPTARRLTVTFDGKVALNQEQVFYPAAPESVVLGFNRLVPDIVQPMFSGRIDAVHSVAFDTLPDLGLMRHYGAVDMTVVFARGAQGAAEPLVVTGVEGAGDFIYLRYLEGSKMIFGFDHWGIGGILGKSVEVDTWKSHRLRMTMGSLYPPGDNVGKLRTLVKVWLDDTVVLEGDYACHPSTRMAVRVGENAIGGSTCGPKFSGQIQRLERLARPIW
jgi:hypothetical protein